MAKIRESKIQPVQVEANMINLKFVELHAPLFLAGNNMSQKIDITKRPGLYLQYDQVRGMLLVWFKHSLAMVPKESVLSMIPINVHDTGYQEPSFDVRQSPAVEAAQPNTRIQAQVSTPTGHVFANEPGLKGQAGI